MQAHIAPPPAAAIDAAAVDALVEWMIDGAPPRANAREIVESICTRLSRAGVPIARFALFIYTLHPSLGGRGFVWSPDEEVRMVEADLGLFTTEEYTTNPLPGVLESRKAVRRRLCDPACPNDYKILGELREKGFTDYFIHPLVFTTGETNAASWSSRAPQGFSDEALAAIERVHRPLARLTEIYMLRLNASNLLSTYVGRGSGDQILRGRVHRGDGEEIEAVILFVDIVGFTTLSNTMAGADIVAMLNGAFDVLVPPVEREGGEVLKFLGDGFFAIFPYADAAGIEAAARAAMRAVAEGEAELAKLDLGRPVAFRSAIHCGRFHYGNIGGANRLDFTAIGRPVNYAARLLAAASALSRSRVASEAVATASGTPLELAGEMDFEGFGDPQKVYVF